ncbi:retropepsin-like aspartic protease family protein [Alteromonas gilva]|uniref:TIGR02281 family clan AA aspartic protease n=1 Tax=Alteromonas gilva TaxID=2987522 RepID=A0ABT5KZH9_9ALTE|nr:TIGR02281 family clan AA aspartic protease [Alteromonas gilva]MDC8830179.1 TIGR02281 family clan AA aspartic protease [Alteromonas gilva]
MTEPSTDTRSTAKWMFVLAWACLFGLLVIIFGDLLEQQVNPNQAPVSLRSGEQVEIRLEQNRQGHYVVSGTINEQPVVFLVDTGATSVAVPAHLADELGLQRGRSGLASTANGTVRIYQTEIAKLGIGAITLYNVDANINPGMQSDHILLGMSALKQLEFTQRGKTLILRTL